MAKRLSTMESDTQQARSSADILKDDLRRLSLRLRNHEVSESF